jgi:hypothetical protein
MKKAKIMLMSTVVLAVVGGALAFKAKAVDKTFCIQPEVTPVNAQSTTLPEFCNEPIAESKIDGSALFYATTAPDPECALVTSCPAIPLVHE